MDKKLITGALIAVIVIAVLVIALPSLDNDSDVTPVTTPTSTPPLTPTETGTESSQTTEATPAPTQAQISCEMCHQGNENLEPHLNGGQYCNNPGCHGSPETDVHLFHPSQSCQDCHSTMPPKVPEVKEGSVSCELCHAYPDGSKPSYGNLVDIHMPRGYDCTTCHTGPISEIHSR